MSSAGHVRDALNRMRFNNSQRKSPNTYLIKEKYFTLAYGKVNHGKVYAKDNSDEELQRIRKVVREKIKKRKETTHRINYNNFPGSCIFIVFYMIKILTKVN